MALPPGYTIDPDSWETDDEDAAQSSGFVSGLASEFGYNDINNPTESHVGAWDNDITSRDVAGVALPAADLVKHFGSTKDAQGKMVEVKVGDKTGVFPIVDVGPGEGIVARQGPTIDLTFGAARQLGHSGGLDKAEYKILKPLTGDYKVEAQPDTEQPAVGPPPGAKPLSSEYKVTVDEGPAPDPQIESLKSDVQPVALDFLNRAQEWAKSNGLEVRVTEGYRTPERQEELYAQGRTQPGSIVTNARAGQSNHQSARAFDVGIFKNGKEVENDKLWRELGQIGKDTGLSWGGDFKSIYDPNHFELLGSRPNQRPQAASGTDYREMGGGDEQLGPPPGAKPLGSDYTVEVQPEGQPSTASARQAELAAEAGLTPREKLERRSQAYVESQAAKSGEVRGALPVGEPEVRKAIAVAPRESLMAAIARTESSGYEVPHTIGKPDEPEGDRAPTVDMENLVKALKQREGDLITKGDAATAAGIAGERSYWENQIKTKGMSAEQAARSELPRMSALQADKLGLDRWLDLESGMEVRRGKPTEVGAFTAAGEREAVAGEPVTATGELPPVKTEAPLGHLISPEVKKFVEERAPGTGYLTELFQRGAKEAPGGAIKAAKGVRTGELVAGEQLKEYAENPYSRMQDPMAFAKADIPRLHSELDAQRARVASMRTRGYGPESTETPFQYGVGSQAQKAQQSIYQEEMKKEGDLIRRLRQAEDAANGNLGQVTISDKMSMAAAEQMIKEGKRSLPEINNKLKAWDEKWAPYIDKKWDSDGGIQFVESMSANASPILASLANPYFGGLMMYGQNVEANEKEITEKLKKAGKPIDEQAVRKEAHERAVDQTVMEYPGQIFMTKFLGKALRSLPANWGKQTARVQGQWAKEAAEDILPELAQETLVTTPTQDLISRQRNEQMGISKPLTHEEAATATLTGMGQAALQTVALGAAGATTTKVSEAAGEARAQAIADKLAAPAGPTFAERQAQEKANLKPGTYRNFGDIPAGPTAAAPAKAPAPAAPTGTIPATPTAPAVEPTGITGKTLNDVAPMGNLGDRRGYMKKRKAEGATTEEAAAELSAENDQMKAKLDAATPEGSQIKDPETGRIYQKEPDGTWKGVEKGDVKSVTLDPNSTIVRVGYKGETTKAAPVAGPTIPPVAPLTPAEQMLARGYQPDPETGNWHDPKTGKDVKTEDVLGKGYYQPAPTAAPAAQAAGPTIPPVAPAKPGPTIPATPTTVPASEEEGPMSQAEREAKVAEYEQAREGKPSGQGPLTSAGRALQFEDESGVSPERSAQLERLGSSLAQHPMGGGQPIKLVPVRRKVRGTTQSKALDSAISGFEQAFGKRVQFVRSGSGETLPFTGLADPSDPNTIFLDAAGDRNVLALVGHEWGHTLKASNPQLHGEMVEQMKPLVKEWAAQEAKLRKEEGYPQEEVSDEVASNHIGDAFTRPDFWKKLNKKNPSLFKRVVKSVNDFFKSLVKRARGSEWGTEEFISNVEAIHKVIADAVNAAVTKGPEPTLKEAMAEGPKFAPRGTELKAAMEGEKAEKLKEKMGGLRFAGRAEPVAPREFAVRKHGFYSKLEQTVIDKIPKSASPEQVKGTIAGAQLKPEEIKWSGVNQAIDRIASENQGKVPKDKLLQYLHNDGAVRLEEEKMEKPTFGQYQLPGGENYREVVLAMPEGKGPGYTSSHFPDVPNYVAHARMNDRTDAEGRPGTFLEEIQSDRHQQGREKGYLEDRLEGTVPGARVPDAPFRKDWPVQLFKRALRDAVSEGKKWIGWTNGETQAERYDLSKQVDEVKAIKDPRGTYSVTAIDKYGTRHNLGDSLTPEKLADTIGKDLAAQITEQPAGVSKVYKGEGLKVGGEGQKTFYDKILRNQVEDYLKPWKAKVERSSIDVSEGKSLTGFEKFPEGVAPIWKVEITPQMEKGVSEGQPLFATRKKQKAEAEPAKRELPPQGPKVSPFLHIGSPKEALRKAGEQGWRHPIRAIEDALSELLDINTDAFWESTQDKFRNMPGLEFLSAAMRKNVDRRSALGGKYGDIIHKVRMSVPTWQRKTADQEYGNYWRLNQTKGRDVANRYYEDMSKGGKAFVDLSHKIYPELGHYAANMKERLKIRNSETGRWEDFQEYKSDFKDYHPHRLQEKFMRALDDPEANVSAWNEMMDIMQGEGLTELQAKEKISAYKQADADNGFFGSLERKRVADLPSQLYDYSFAGLTDYVASFADRIAQVEAFGQGKGKDNTGTVWDEAIKRAGNTATQDYIRDVMNQAYGQKSKGAAKIAMTTGTFLSGLHLGNQAAAFANLVSGEAMNMSNMGVMRYFRTLPSAYFNIKPAYEAGVLQRDFQNIMHDGEVGGKWAKAVGREWTQPLLRGEVPFLRHVPGIREVLNFPGIKHVMQGTSQNAAESFVRGHAIGGAKLMLRDAIKAFEKNPRSKDSRQYLGYFKHLGFEGTEGQDLIAEGGEGPLFDRYLREATADVQAGYTYNRQTRFMNSPAGKIYGKYAPWGLEQLSRFQNRVMKPALRGVTGGRLHPETVDIINEDGERETMKVPGEFLPLARYLVVLALAGGATEEGKEWLFGIPKRTATLAQILAKLSKGDMEGLNMAAEKAFMYLVTAGAGGTLGTTMQTGMDAVNRSRGKNPLSPPAFAFLEDTAYALRDILDQGVRAEGTARSVMDWTKRNWGLVRSGTGLANLPGRIDNAWSAPIPYLRKQAALQDVNWLKSQTRRYDKEHGVKAPLLAERPTKTPTSALKENVYEDVLIGDAASARARIREYKKGKSFEEKEAIDEQVKDSIRSRQPIKAGGGGELGRYDFLKWMKRQQADIPFLGPSGGEDVARVKRIDSTYRKSARKVYDDLFPEEVPKTKSLQEYMRKTDLAKKADKPDTMDFSIVWQK